ncbi:MAG: MBL fold metallo-hydrolase [Lachnospiraceae bacterium]|nr:MBL fold metallo-hydrolase [Lachnospiraceae bacterium]
MNKQTLTLKILGCRGSVPIEGEDFKIYGGATSSICVLAETTSDAGHVTEEIYLDSGSGIVNAKPLPDSHISILISHMHIDHLVGMTSFPALSQKDRRIDIYAAARNGLKVNDAIDKLFSPPYWPLKVTDYPSDARYYELKENFNIGNVKIKNIEVNHPGGSSTYKIEFAGKNIVYAIDFEHNENELKKLADFSRNADLMIYDGQYTPDEYPGCFGYGHSIPEVGIEFAKNNGIKRILFSHHAPEHTDSFLSEWEKKIKEIFPDSSFAKAGMEIKII